MAANDNSSQVDDAKDSKWGAARILGILIRFVVGGFFIYMGANKISDPFVFGKSINEYQLIPVDPPVLLNSVAILLPWVEVIAGLCMIVGIFSAGASAILGTMLVVFTSAIMIRVSNESLSLTDELDCGCGSGLVVIWEKYVENGLLILGSFIVFVMSWRAKSNKVD